MRANRSGRRNMDIEEKRLHVPLVDRTSLDPPPIVVAVVGPPKVFVLHPIVRDRIRRYYYILRKFVLVHSTRARSKELQHFLSKTKFCYNLIHFRVHLVSLHLLHAKSYRSPQLIF